MSFFNDHTLLVVVMVGAVSFYIIEMLFFWFKWHRLSTKMQEEQLLSPSVKEIHAELDVLENEIAALRRQVMMKAGNRGGKGFERDLEHFFISADVFKKNEGLKKEVKKPTPTSAPVEKSFFQPHVENYNDPSLMTPPERVQPKAPETSQPNFSRGVEMLHRRVVELARNGMNSSDIATECQLSQTETELILSLNGIKRSV